MYYNLLDEIQKTPLTLSAVIIVLLVLLLAIFFDTARKEIDTRFIALAGVSLALSIGLSFVKLFKLPQGGSITLASTLPFLLFAYIYGTKKSVLVGLILGLLNFAIEPYIVHPAQVILDYIIAYGAMGLVSIFSKIKLFNKIPQLEFALGSILSIVIRYACHVLSGVFAFSSFANTEVFAYSFIYNSYVLIDIAIAIAVGVLLLSQKQIKKLILDKKEKEKKIIE